MFQTDPFALIALLVGLSLVAFVAMVATSYLKIVVVVSLIRNALGIQSQSIKGLRATVDEAIEWANDLIKRIEG